MLRAFIVLVAMSCLASCQTDDKALFEAIKEKDSDRVRVILSSGSIDIDPPPEPCKVNKPLVYAAAYGNLEIVRMLLDNGADINGRVAYGDVALIKASEHKNHEIIGYLIEAGADVNKPNAFGVSPFIGFCVADNIAIVKLALEHGGKINESYQNRTSQGKGKNNFTALQASSYYGNLEIVELLLSRGGNPLVKTSDGETSSDLAKKKGHHKVVKIIEKFLRGIGRAYRAESRIANKGYIF